MFSHVLDRLKHFLRIHDERNFCAFFWRKAREMLEFGVVERRGLRSAVQTDDVLDSIVVCDGVVCSCKKSTTFEGIELARVCGAPVIYGLDRRQE